MIKPEMSEKINKCYEDFEKYLNEGNSYQSSLTKAYIKLTEKYNPKEANEIMNIMRDTLLD